GSVPGRPLQLRRYQRTGSCRTGMRVAGNARHRCLDCRIGAHRRGQHRDVASMAHADLLDLRVELFPYAPFAARAWELRSNITSYDAWYVAVAEFFGA